MFFIVLMPISGVHFFQSTTNSLAPGTSSGLPVRRQVKKEKFYEGFPLWVWLLSCCCYCYRLYRMQAYCLCKNGKSNRLSRLGYILHIIPFNQFIESVIQLASDGPDGIGNWPNKWQNSFLELSTKNPPIHSSIISSIYMLLLWFLLLANLMLMLPNFEGGLLAAGIGRK
jgi:hypothetical protein